MSVSPRYKNSISIPMPPPLSEPSTPTNVSPHAPSGIPPYQSLYVPIPIPPPLILPDSPSVASKSKSTRVVPYAPPPPSILPQHLPETPRMYPKKIKCGRLVRVRPEGSEPPSRTEKIKDFAYGCMLCMCWCFVPME
jgi:hypothetical protein